MKTTLIETYTNAADGIEARVLLTEETGKFHAVLRDTDADAVVGIYICPTLELATAKAKLFVKEVK